VFGDAFANRHREAAADHVAQNVVDDVIEVELFEDFRLLEQFDRGDDAASGAADAGSWPARFDAINAIEAGMKNIVGLHHGFLAQGVQHGGDVRTAPQGIGRVGLGVTSELQNLVACHGEGSAQIGGGGALANSPLP